MLFCERKNGNSFDTVHENKYQRRESVGDNSEFAAIYGVDRYPNRKSDDLPVWTKRNNQTEVSSISSTSSSGNSNSNHRNVDSNYLSAGEDLRIRTSRPGRKSVLPAWMTHGTLSPITTNNVMNQISPTPLTPASNTFLQANSITDQAQGWYQSMREKDNSDTDDEDECSFESSFFLLNKNSMNVSADSK